MEKLSFLLLIYAQESDVFHGGGAGMDEPSNFHTQKGYDLAAQSKLTAAMEDYLEMICRLSGDNGYTRVHLLAEHLNVKPSSASKMVDNLKDLGLAQAERYGCISPTPEGYALGEYLLYRHNLLNRFLCWVNHSDSELEQVERIEHYIDERTIRNIALLLDRLSSEN